MFDKPLMMDCGGGEEEDEGGLGGGRGEGEEEAGIREGFKLSGCLTGRMKMVLHFRYLQRKKAF